MENKSASIHTFVQGDPEEDVFRMCEGNGQTRPCFVLFISRSVHSNRADHTFTWRGELSDRCTQAGRGEPAKVIQHMSISNPHLCPSSRSPFPDWKRPARWGRSTSSTALLCYGRPSRRSPLLSDSSHLPQLLLCSKAVPRGDAVQWMWCPERSNRTRVKFIWKSK